VTSYQLSFTVALRIRRREVSIQITVPHTFYSNSDWKAICNFCGGSIFCLENLKPLEANVELKFHSAREVLPQAHIRVPSTDLGLWVAVAKRSSFGFGIDTTAATSLSLICRHELNVRNGVGKVPTIWRISSFFAPHVSAHQVHLSKVVPQTTAFRGVGERGMLVGTPRPSRHYGSTKSKIAHWC